MIRTRLIILGAFAVLAISATAAATASAHEYFVEGAAIKEALDGTFTSGSSNLRGTLLGVKIDIRSKKDKGTFLIEPEGKTKGTISFEENSLYELNTAGEDVLLTNCVVPLIDAHFKDKLIELNGKLADEFESVEANEIFTTFSITGTGCALKKAVNEVTGTVPALLPEGEVEKVLHIVEIHPADDTQHLKFNGETAELLTDESLVLSGTDINKKWSAKK